MLSATGLRGLRICAVLPPQWMLDERRAWVGVPLIHGERLFGLILLAAPDYRRVLDWEDFDLLRTAGRQAASSLAEAYGQEALSNAQRFEEFNRRFAFILHDIKNLVSQLSLAVAQRRAPRRQSRVPRRHGRDPAQLGRQDERPAREAFAAGAGSRPAGRAAAASHHPVRCDRREAPGP